MKGDGELSFSSEGDLKERFSYTRKKTADLCDPLERDDYMIQSTPETSPPKWHLGHTTWFFENFVLKPFSTGYNEFDRLFSYVFNSYYDTVGNYVPKPMRATISRPSLERVLDYRRSVTDEILGLLENCREADRGEISRRVIMGVNHEQQHQELLLMDIKRNHFSSPYKPVYAPRKKAAGFSSDVEWIPFEESMDYIGHGEDSFSFDNETPMHRELVPAFRIASIPVTNAEYLKFMENGGYRKPELWLSEGWQWRQRERWEMPLYWTQEGDRFMEFTLSGNDEVDPEAPVMHISYYEADAFARWSGNRLPTEVQWEHAVRSEFSTPPDNFLETGHYSALPVEAKSGRVTGIGNGWEWTSSAYLPYPGFRPLPGSLGEYNGKFMSDQMVLRGSSFATPRDHYRISYRNFYHPESRWHFSGIRLSRDGINE